MGKLKRACEVCADERVKFLTCPRCQFEGCNQCYTRYLDEQKQLPACMSCRVVFSKEQLQQGLGVDASTRLLSTKRKLDVVQIDEQFHTQTMEVVVPLAKRMCLTIALVKEQAVLLRAAELKRDALDEEYDDGVMEIGEDGLTRGERLALERRQLDNDVKLIREHIETLARTVRRFDDLIREQPMAVIAGGGAAGGASPQGRVEVRMFRCLREGCNGAFKSDLGVCMICDATACVKCLTPMERGADHECAKENIKTARLIITETKSCPRCHVPIQKDTGCDQMMCTSCLHVFSWNTGKEERGVIHNPHYFQLSEEKRAEVRGTVNGDPGAPCMGPGMLRHMQDSLEAMVRSQPEFRCLDQAMAYVGHLTGAGGVDGLRMRRDNMAVGGARDVELSGRVPRLQMLMQQELPPSTFPHGFSFTDAHEAPPKPYTRARYENALFLTDGRYRAEMERLTMRIDYSEIMIDLALAVTRSKPGQREHELGLVAMLDAWKRMQVIDKKGVDKWLGRNVTKRRNRGGRAII